MNAAAEALWVFLIGLAFFPIAYVLGSCPFSYWTVKKKTGRDIRDSQSGNVGSSNAERILEEEMGSEGKKLGYLVMILDGVKGALPTYASLWIFSLISSLKPLNVLVACLIGLFAIAGHIYSILLPPHQKDIRKARKFLIFYLPPSIAGKGVATSFGSIVPILFYFYMPGLGW